MKGYRNLLICGAGLLSSTWIMHTGMNLETATDPMGLASMVGANWLGITGVVFGRGYNKGKEAMNGGVQ